MMLCSRCKKNVAVVFVTKEVGGRKENEALCLVCAKEIGINTLEQFAGNIGLQPEELENLSNQVNDFLNIEPDAFGDEANENTPVADLMNFFNFNVGRSSEETESKRTQTQEKKILKKKRILDTYGINLTAAAAEGKIDRVIGRQAEIDRLVQILNRRNKNNPVLLGEPGVGKTAIAEGFALRIAEKNVPAKLLNKEVYLLDFTAIVAGTQFRGQFEARLKSIIEEVKKLGNIILVIDELHNIVGAGDAEGAMSAANILKPALARGEIQVIGATTLTEYRKHIEKDAALERRFQPIIVEEPSIEESIEILRGIKGYYENYHQVKISDEVIKSAVILSERYITDRFLPDKAIDVIDEACSKANLNNTALVKIAELESELKKIQDEKDNAISEDSIENYQRAANLKMTECKLQNEIKELKNSLKDVHITVDDIAAVIWAQTKIPVQRITELETQKLIGLEERLHKRVIGQDEAVSAVSRAIRRNRAGLAKKKRPSSFIFVGPTGVGKTELAKALAEALFDTEEALIRLDMSEYMEKHTTSKIIGSPPGYVGYDDAGQLTEKVRRKPYSVILFDEVEKAHPDVLNILLQIMDEGKLTDSHGKVINFENTIIVMTSNAGSDWKNSALGFVTDPNRAVSDKVKTALKDVFRPEFLNRVDEVVVFNPLTKYELYPILDKMLGEYGEVLAQKGITMKVADGAKDYFVEKGYDEKNGARPLRRLLQRELEDKLSGLIITGQLAEGGSCTVVIEDGEIKVKIEN